MISSVRNNVKGYTDLEISCMRGTSHFCWLLSKIIREKGADKLRLYYIAIG